jgi:hypothetical protein
MEVVLIRVLLGARGAEQFRCNFCDPNVRLAALPGTFISPWLVSSNSFNEDHTRRDETRIPDVRRTSYVEVSRSVTVHGKGKVVRAECNPFHPLYNGAGLAIQS